MLLPGVDLLASITHGDVGVVSWCWCLLMVLFYYAVVLLPSITHYVPLYSLVCPCSPTRCSVHSVGGNRQAVEACVVGGGVSVSLVWGLIWDVPLPPYISTRARSRETNFLPSVE